MKTKLILAAALVCTSICTNVQDAKAQGAEGKAIVQVFGNFHTGFGNENSDRGFELDRSYLGYEYKLENGLSIKGVMDIGQSSVVDDYHRIAYIKNAMVSWKKNNFTLNGGLISTIQFNFQEKFWGYRYIMKSFQDMYKYGSSADLGISASYKLADWISADAIIVNGEGYKKIQKSDGLNYGAGITLTPAEGFQIRLYGGINESDEEGKKNIGNFAAFAGYRNSSFSIGAEYNYMKNASGKEDANMSGFSIYGSAKLSKVTDIYARYDNSASEDDWNISKDESAAIIGLQFKPCKYVKIAPNFRMEIPKASGADNKCYAYISCYFGF